MNSDPIGSGPQEGIGRFIGGVFGFAFFGAGVSVIGFLWSQPFGQVGSPPIFFRIFGSLIATVFVAVGGGILYGAITGKSIQPRPNFRHTSRIIDPRDTSDRTDSHVPSADGYSCDSCGAPLDSNADVSPHGDVKCGHCDRWFNIHAK